MDQSRLSDKAIFLNTNMVKMLMAFKPNEYTMVTGMFKPHVLGEVNQYIHMLLFLFQEDRDAAYELLKDYKEKSGLEYQFYYKGERLTSAMVYAIEANHGDFQAWKIAED